MKKKTLKNQRVISVLLVIILFGIAYLAFYLISQTKRQTTEINNLVASKNNKMSNESVSNLSNLIISESKKHQLDPKLIVAIISIESDFQQKAKSKAGAIGLMQIRPFVAKAAADELGIKWEGEKTLNNPETNVKIGIYYFAKLHSRFNNNIRLSLSAYNHGPTAVRKLIRLGKTLPTSYSNKVLAAYQDLG